MFGTWFQPQVQGIECALTKADGRGSGGESHPEELARTLSTYHYIDT